jgi:CelD/BcsL family acetyltransferase involved in cellulose biosynthesis/adenylate kinase family enzyme
VKRFVVTGPTGAGKTELARELGERLGIRVLHLDTLFWRPGWVATPPPEWTALQRRELAAGPWIVEAQFDDMLPDWVDAADTVVFVDASPLRCLWRVARRRLSRRPSPGTPAGTEPGAFHRALAKFLRNQWRYRRAVRPELLAELARERDGRRVVVLRRPAETCAFLRSVDSPSGAGGNLLDVAAATAPAELTLGTISSDTAFSGLADQWDRLVRSRARPSPFLLHAWLVEWWRHYGDGGELAIHVAWRRGRLVGALPLCLRRQHGLRVLSFVGGDPALADLLVAGEDRGEVAAALAERAVRAGQDFADFSGLPAGSRLASALGPSAVRLIERAEAPVLDLSPGWDSVYSSKLSSKKRNHHRRRRRQLAALGRVEIEVARTPAELERALEDAFRVHVLRWDGRPDGSGFATPVSRRYHHAAIRALAPLDVPRIVLLKIEGRPVAFHYYLLLERRMYVYRIAFDPAFGRFSPGLINTLDAIEAAAAEGATRVEFLGGAERYKVELADRLEPLYEGFGLAGSLKGKAAVAARLGGIRVRKQLKRSPVLRRFYFEGLAPARRLLARVT